MVHKTRHKFSKKNRALPILAIAFSLGACAVSRQYVPVPATESIPANSARVYVLRTPATSRASKALRPGVASKETLSPTVPARDRGAVKAPPSLQAGTWTGDGVPIEIFDGDGFIGTLRVKTHLVYDRAPGLARIRTGKGAEVQVELQPGQAHYIQARYVETHEEIQVLEADRAGPVLLESRPPEPVYE